MDYNIVFKNSVKNDLSVINIRDVKFILGQIENYLKENPYNYPMLKGKFNGLRKFRVGNFRVIYSIEENDVIILRIADRKEIYKKKK